MSRFSGVWAGMKTIQEIVESSAVVDVSTERVRIALPDFDMPPGGVHIRWPDHPLDQEARLFDHKWYAALAYVRANRLNHNAIEGPNDRLGLIASGKAYNDTRQALLDLGLDDDTCRRIGLRLHKVAVVWPLEAQTTREFATGLREILVIEEKRQVIEYQLKEELYNWRADVRPNVLGKFDEVEGDHTGGEWSMPNPSAHTLLRANADLNPAIIARAVAQRLRKLGVPEDVQARIDAHLSVLDAQQRAMVALDASAQQDALRQPWFCSGCPHNSSTKVPEGSHALGGIGCHYMATWMDRNTVGFTQMGGEGVPWVGQQAFVTDAHVFANLGDGTYFHSGILAIRQSIAAGVNITYKILYNDAVAMTGGQQVGERPEGHSVVQIAQSLSAEGARLITIVTDEPSKYQGVVGLPEGIAIEHRDRMDAIQREMRERTGTTVIIYDQTCATEKRRRRKRGTLVTPDERVVINPAVCEGCGDCSTQSNCLSVEPLETEFGRKRRINQNTCNQDFSCVKGFCPSFVTVTGARLRRTPSASTAPSGPPTDLPMPVLPELGEQVWGMVLAGVGGTGVITIGQIVGVAAHLEGKGVVTQDAAGLAQKGGATWSHVLLAARPDAIRTTRVSAAAADLVVGCDPLVAAQADTWQRLRPGRTRMALNSHASPTAAFVRQPDWQNPSQACVARLLAHLGDDAVGVFDAERSATTLMGDSLYANPMLLGYAWQKGWLPVGFEALMQAMVLNAVAVANNQQAFAWGRWAAHDPKAFAQRLAGVGAQTVVWHKPASLVETVQRRVAFLTQYQNAAYARRYEQAVRRIEQAEAPLQQTRLTMAVANSLFKLMAYKDEYEVARLHSDPAFRASVREQFEGDVQLHFHLAPPLLGDTDAEGQPRKRRFGPWMLPVFATLARFKGLRGTPLDVFGRTEERRSERQWVSRYEAAVSRWAESLNAGNHDLAVRWAQIPQGIKGYGHVKAKAQAQALEAWVRCESDWA
jgi:indolepyruvate ferredoxin oxidoreductase